MSEDARRTRHRIRLTTQVVGGFLLGVATWLAMVRLEREFETRTRGFEGSLGAVVAMTIVVAVVVATLLLAFPVARAAMSATLLLGILLGVGLRWEPLFRLVDNLQLPGFPSGRFTLLLGAHHPGTAVLAGVLGTWALWELRRGGQISPPQSRREGAPVISSGADEASSGESRATRGIQT